MRKGLFFTMVLTFAGMVFLTNCTTGKQMLIKEENISQLQGMWEGKREFSGSLAATGWDIPTTLEITSSTLPLKGQIIHHNFAGEGRNVPFPFEGGEIKDGNLYIKTSQIEVTLVLHDGGGKGRLTGNFYLVSPGVTPTIGQYTLFKK